MSWWISNIMVMLGSTSFGGGIGRASAKRCGHC